MRLPWVSRVLYDAAVASAERDRAVCAQTGLRLTAADARYDALLEKYHALRTAGAALPEPTRSLPVAEPNVVTQAIIAKAGPSLLLRKHFADYVALQRAQGIPEDEIAGAILRGESGADEDAA